MTADTTWHGELAIPWAAITANEADPPTLLRFNFVQHKSTTGESSSWAGPVDYGRDDKLMGLIDLRTPGQPQGAKRVLLSVSDGA